MSARRTQFILMASTLILCTATGTAYALKSLANVTPSSAEHVGFTIEPQLHEEGFIRFTVTRDLSKVRQYDKDSGLTIDRSASLAVYDQEGLVIRIAPEADPTNNNELVYTLDLAPKYVSDAKLTIHEYAAYTDLEKVPLLGGGVIYKIQLADFVDQ